MSKRFVDTELWQKEWFQDLTLKEKLLVKYIFESCDIAGVWNGNFKMASFIIGEKVSIDDLELINKKKHQFDILENNNIFVTDFIKFQYGELSENCKPHAKVISMLKHYGLFERVIKDYAKGIDEPPEPKPEKKKEDEKHIYGTYQNVKLTDKELSRLQEEYGQTGANKAIEYLSAYKKEKGYKNKDDNLTLRRWVFDACKISKLPANSLENYGGF